MGAGARYGVALLIPGPLFATFIVNVVGAGLLGYTLARLRLAGRSRSITVPFLGVGFLGAFTTFSSFAVQLLHGPALEIVAYAVGSLAGGILAGAIGLSFGRRT